MKVTIYISLLLILILSCKRTDIQPVTLDKVTLSGEWRYVGKFSHAADYRCTICPKFDYDKSIYRITFKKDGSFDARINLLITKGNYVGNPNVNATSTNYYGTLGITNFQSLNKPIETQADTDFKQYFLDINNYTQITKTSNFFGYDELLLGLKTSNFSEYLLFVRK